MDMIALFMRWVHIIWGHTFRLFGQTRALDLPSDIILDIFSRLPAELVFQCRDQCRMIFTLTTSSSFIEMHLNRATSIVVFQYASCCAIFNEQKGVFESVISLCFVDEVNKKITKKRLQVSFRCMDENHWCPFSLFQSCNGLLLFENKAVFVIWNPITQEHIIMDIPDSSYVCGFYFHQKTGEYKVLCVHELKKNFEFIIISILTGSSKRTSCFSHPPHYKAPVILNGMLHWLVWEERYKRKHRSCLKSSESILSFDMDSENIRTIARPTVEYDRPPQLFSMHLLKKEGFLWFCDVTSYSYIDIWVLVDYETEVWIKLQRIGLDFLSPSGRKDIKYILSSLLLDKEELIVRRADRLFRYNLQQNVAKKAEMRGIENLHEQYSLLHTNSLVSLHNDTNSPCFIICRLD